MEQAILIYSPKFSTYQLSPTHPLKPERLARTFDLIEAYGMLDQPECDWREPEEATEEQLLLIHSPQYLKVVRACGQGLQPPDAYRFGLGTSDNPIFKGMYQASALCAGGSILAADLVASGKAKAAFNIGGGLHHAHPDQASGFCIFNDPAIAIAHLLRQSGNGCKIAYIDIDAHHGDGVQEAFYDRSEVLTISVHQSGRFLFPGTGEVTEMGVGEGEGYSVNLPLAPFTDDETYLWAFQEVVPPLIEAFSPDFVVSQLGADAHYSDPLTNLSLTTRGYIQAVAMIGDLAPGWVAVGGGGYNLDVVPRAWTLAYALMADQSLPNELPADQTAYYEEPSLHDPEGAGGNVTSVNGMRSFAEASVEEIKRVIFPYHGL